MTEGYTGNGFNCITIKQTFNCLQFALRQYITREKTKNN